MHSSVASCKEGPGRLNKGHPSASSAGPGSAQRSRGRSRCTPRQLQPRTATRAQVTATVDEVEFGFHHKLQDGVDFVFVDHPSFPRPGGLYGDENGVYGDNQWRFKLLCQAALEAPLQLPLGERGVYGQDCVFVANGAPARVL